MGEEVEEYQKDNRSYNEFFSGRDVFLNLHGKSIYSTEGKDRKRGHPDFSAPIYLLISQIIPFIR
jgi:hypothetical protein